MKICLVSDQYSNHLNDMKGDEISGIALHTLNMVEGLLQRNHEVTLICNQKQDKLEKDFKFIFIDCWKYDYTPKKWLSLSIILSKQIIELQNKQKYDIFHSLDAKQGALSVPKLSIPTIGNVNDYYAAKSSFSPVEFYAEFPGDWVKRYLYHVFTKIFEGKYLKNYDCLIANSQATKKYVQENYKLPENKLVMIHKALPYFQNNKNVIVDKKDGKYNILMVGTNLQRKGIYYLIEAAPKIISEFPDLMFTIIGKLQKPVIEKCKALNVLNNFKFYGNLPHKEIEEFNRNADIAVMPSLTEGLGMSIVESMSFGVPVVVTGGTGLDDLVTDGKEGFLIPPKSSRDIYEKILLMIKDFELRKKMSENAFQKAKKFNKEKQLKKTLELYESVLRKK